jgi:hypothetical protein
MSYVLRPMYYVHMFIFNWGVKKNPQSTSPTYSPHIPPHNTWRLYAVRYSAVYRIPYAICRMPYADMLYAVCCKLYMLYHRYPQPAAARCCVSYAICLCAYMPMCLPPLPPYPMPPYSIVYVVGRLLFSPAIRTDEATAAHTILRHGTYRT